MEYNIEKTGKSSIKIEVTVPAEVYNEALKKSFEKNREYFHVEGFRKGKAPYGMVKKRYGVEALYEDADNIVLNDTYFNIIKDEDLKPVDYPKIDITERGENKEFKYTAEVETEPEFDLPDFKGMKVEKHVHPFDESSVDDRLSEMREQNARILSKPEKDLEKGDTAVFDFEGTIDGKEFQGGSADNYELEIGSGSFIGNFEEQMEGMKVGEEKDVTVTFPEKYGVPELNGKEAVFHVKLNDIKVKELPELDDEFASEVSEFETLDELRGDVSKNLKADYDKHMEDAAREGALSKAVDMTEIEIPSAMVDRQVDRMINELGQKLQMQGMEMKQYFEMAGSDEEATREMMRPNALRRAKTDLVVEKLIKDLKVEAADEELKAIAEDYSKLYGQDDKFTEMLLTSNREGIEHDVKLKKVLDHLVENAEFVEPSEHDHDHEGHDHE